MFFSQRSQGFCPFHQELHDNLDVMTAAVSQKGEAGNGTKVFDGW
jgi:primosomal protein N''